MRVKGCKSVVARGTFIAFILSVLSACAIVDNFAPRASSYNGETASSKTSVILKNVLRAAFSEPLQFTDISSISGTGNYNTQSGSSLPIAAIPSTATRIFSISPQATLAGSTQFSVANLNTQEFYYGLQTPVSMQLIASYINAGSDPRILLPLVVSSIEVTAEGKRSTLYNDASTPEAFFAFYQSMVFLIDYGLSAERIRTTKQIGPNLSEKDATDPKFVSALISSTNSDSLTVKKLNGKYRLTKSVSSYRFCFDRLAQAAKPFAKINYRSLRLSEEIEDLVIPLGKAGGTPISGLSIRIRPKYFCGAKAAAGAVSEKQVIADNLSLTTRSVQGIFNYLGQLVRIELGLASGKGTALSIPSRQGRKFRLFSLERRSANPGDLSVEYNGETYTLRVDPSGSSDGSSRVLQLLTELLALQSSAKNFPTPNVISVISP